MANYLDENGVSHFWEKIKAKITNSVANKVDKIDGKGLSTNDYTTEEKNKLAGVADKANNYVHPTTAGNKHVPSGGASGQILRWSADGTAAWGVDTKYEEFRGSTSSFNGTAGLVPAPTKNETGYFLSANGGWENPISTFGQYSTANNVEISVGSGASYETVVIEAANGENGKAGVMSAMDKSKLDGLPFSADLESTYAKKTDITGVYKYKGSVATADKLPTSGQQKGDVYNIVAASKYGAAGANVAWDGSAWDTLGEVFTITSISNAKIDEICV